MDPVDPTFNKIMLERVGAESVDAMFASDPSLTGDRADYLMRNRSVVVEVKTLKEMPLKEIAELVRPYATEIGLGVGFVEVDEVVRRNPRGAELSADLNNLNSRALRRAIEGANGQIRATKRTLKLNSAVGLVFILNASNIVITETDIAEAFRRQLDRSRDPFESVQHVAIASPHHVISQGPHKGRVPLFASPVRTHAQQRAASASAEIARQMVSYVASTLADPIVSLPSDSSGRLPIVCRHGEPVITPSFVKPEEVMRAVEERRATRRDPEPPASCAGV